MLDIPTEENTMTFTKFAVAAAAALLCAGSVIAAPVEGTDYVVLEKPIPNASGTFIKVYSYDCPFCYKYDKSVVPAVKAKLDKEMKFLDYHLHTTGKYGKEGSEVLAVMWVADEAAGRDHAAYGGAQTCMNVGHRRDVMKDERQRGRVEKLLTRLVVERLRPDVNRDASFASDDGKGRHGGTSTLVLFSFS